MGGCLSVPGTSGPPAQLGGDLWVGAWGDGTNYLPPGDPGEGLVPLHQRASHPTRELDLGIGTP